jgi:uncharacterized protein YbaR (Trm112 family)
MPAATPPALDPRLLEILACPAEDHAPLRVETKRAEPTTDAAQAQLVCTACGRRYPIVDGIPVLLLTEAEPTVGAEAERAEPTIGAEAERAEPTIGAEAERAEPTIGAEAERAEPAEPDSAG